MHVYIFAIYVRLSLCSRTTAVRWPNLCSVNFMLGEFTESVFGKSGPKKKKKNKINGHCNEIVVGTCGICNSSDMYRSETKCVQWKL